MSPLNAVHHSALEQLAQQSGSGVGKSSDSQGADFSKQLMDVLKEVNDTQNTAAQKQNDLMTGRPNADYHDLMISMEKASVAMQLTMSVRNKILDAYQEVAKTQV